MPKKIKLPPQSNIRSVINNTHTIQSDMARSIAAARLYVQDAELPKTSDELTYLSTRLNEFLQIRKKLESAITDIAVLQKDNDKLKQCVHEALNYAPGKYNIAGFDYTRV